jgi:hypothetical protein
MNKEQLLARWRERAKTVQDAHYDASATLKRFHYLTGLPLVVLSALATSNILAEAGVFPSFIPYSKLTAAILSLLVTVLAAIQAFMGFEKRSENHYRAGVKYGAMKRAIECCDPAAIEEKELAKIRQKWDALTEETPIIPLRIWRANEKKKNRDTTEQFVSK